MEADVRQNCDDELQRCLQSEEFVRTVVSFAIIGHIILPLIITIIECRPDFIDWIQRRLDIISSIDLVLPDLL